MNAEREDLVFNPSSSVIPVGTSVAPPTIHSFVVGVGVVGVGVVGVGAAGVELVNFVGIVANDECSTISIADSLSFVVFNSVVESDDGSFVVVSLVFDAFSNIAVVEIIGAIVVSSTVEDEILGSSGVELQMW